VVLSLALVLAAQLAAVEPKAPTLEHAIAASKRVRVTLAGGSFELLQPWAEPDGLHFRKVKGYPPPRLGSMAARRVLPLEPPTSPLAWAAIERVEQPMTHQGKSLGGAFVGLVGGTIFGTLIGYGVAFGTDNATAGYAAWGAVTLAGMVLGSNAGKKDEWRQVYPGLPQSMVPDVRTR
jgi:hypothetical protein